MPNPNRDRMRMTEDEVKEFLAEQRRMHFASHNADGSIHLVPVNYSFLDDEIAFWADPGSQKCTNLGRDPRISYLIETGDDFASFRGVHGRGTARVVSDREAVQRVGDGFFRGFPPEMIPDEVRANTRAIGEQRVAVVITPERLVSWDHRKVPGVTAADIGR